MMNTMYKRLSVITTALMILALTITGCTSQASNIGLAREKDPNTQNTIGTDFVVAEVGSFDSADTAVVVSTDTESASIKFMNIATGKQYTLSYDGTTYVKDRYNGPMAMSQIKEGDIVDITFLKSKKRLASVQLSPNSWVFDNIENYDLGGRNKTAEIGSNTYSLPDEAMILSEGRRAELMEIVDSDILTVSGIDHTIYSINVQRGHGYLRLSNEQALVGGWIEIGNAVVQRITEDMLIAVPEGSYQVLLTNDNASCVKEVVIERNKEVVLDASDLEILQDKTGKILFSVNPSTATVKVDGEIVNIEKEVELTYGIHQVRLEAEGYLSMAKYIQVGSEYASISFTMEEGDTKDKDDDSVSDNSSLNDIANAVTNNKVYIDAPYDVEVYLDGNYVGVSPISFTKVTGDHTITLSKTGYVSKSYTIYLYDDGQDITYSFADLESEYDNVSGSRRGSGNSTSTSTSATSTSITSTNSSVSGNNQINSIDSERRALITEPKGLQVYLDGYDIGIAGVNAYFYKPEGKAAHTVTFRKDGYKADFKVFFYNDGVYRYEFEISDSDWELEEEEPDNPDNPNPDNTDNSDKTDKPDKPDNPNPDNTDNSDKTDKPDNPNPDNTDNSDKTDKPDNPNSDNTDNSDKTDKPDNPNPDNTDNSDKTNKPDNSEPENSNNQETLPTSISARSTTTSTSSKSSTLGKSKITGK